MAIRCGRLQFSLRMFFVVLTVFALWLGNAVNRAREQRELVKAIESLGGTVQYDWQTGHNIRLKEGEYTYRFYSHSHRPVWIRNLFQGVKVVWFFNAESRIDSLVRGSIPYLQRLRGLVRVNVQRRISERTYRQLQIALPGCEVCGGLPEHLK